MPLYRFECESCGHQFRVLVGNGSSTVPPCPACGAEKARRLLPRVSIAYKGSGYYNTDYRGKKSAGGKTSSAREGSASDSTSASSSDSEA
ncbi:hypothetical protein JW848_11295 [Candidatus Bipolaricaulota bacterium]|nr:hypothetical protein [Candidatus Bipolaricaulota bacterium]